MPRGAGTIRYEGKRGVVWRIKFTDAAGEQCMETLGKEADGWTRKRAEEELRARLVDVKREDLRRPDPLTFEDFAKRWQDDYLPGRNVTTSTTIDYKATIKNHLLPAFGHLRLERVAKEPERVDRYMTEKMRDGLSPKTVANHIRLLSKMLNTARSWRLIRDNPVALVELPKVREREMAVLTEAEIARLLTAYRQLEADAKPGEQASWRLARRLITVALGTACRRGELLALTWGDVALTERRLHVRQAFVRGEMTTPKSGKGRWLDLGPRTVEALEEQFAETVYRSDGDLVFGHPQLGSPLDPTALARNYLKPAIAKAKIEKAFRVWHDLRHTALTHEAAAGNPTVYVQMRAGHAQGSTTERYIHAAQVLFPGAADRGEDRIFADVESKGVES